MILTTEDAQLFFGLHFTLLAYINHQLDILPDVTTLDELIRLSRNEKMELREACYEQPEVLEYFIADNPGDLTPDQLAIVASWRHRVSGNFYIVRHLKRYSVFLSLGEPPHLYGVLGLTEPVDAVCGGRPLPIYVQAVLLPLRDKVIYDGLLPQYSIHFGRGYRTELNRAYNKLRRREGIIEQLVGPKGEPEVRTSLDRQRPRKPPPDWRPIVDRIVAEAGKIRRTATPAQGAAVRLLRTAAKMTQATLHEPEATKQHLQQLRQVRAAVTRLENVLEEGLYEV